MARAIASRLLHEPTLRLKRSSGEEDAYVFVNALRELFGLDPGSAPVQGTDAEVRSLRDARRGRSAS
jgi:Glutamyl-tRNAGlu reductase, dimerisation domain